MTAQYHINPATGEPGRCSATERGCPYLGVSDHYGSPEEARAAYELIQARIGDFMRKSRVPLADGAVVIEVYDPMSDEVPSPPKSGFLPDPAAQRFISAMDNAPKNSLIVIEDGTIFQRGYDGDSWVLRSDRNNMLGLVKGQTTSPATFLGVLKGYGARLETQPKRFYANTDYLAGLGARPSGRAYGFEALSDADLAKAYAKAYNEAEGDYTNIELAKVSGEAIRRGGGQGAFLYIKPGLNRAVPMKNLSLEGIDELREPRKPSYRDNKDTK